MRGETRRKARRCIRRRSTAARIAVKTTGASVQGAGERPSPRAPRRTRPEVPSAACFAAASGAEPAKMRRVAQDCDPKTYMYMASGRKDARIGHFSWYPPTTEGRSPRSGCPSRGASTVAAKQAARWKANQHSSSHEQPNSMRGVTKKVYQTFSQRLPFLLERRAASTKRIVRTPSCAPGKSCGLRSLTAAQNSR